MEAAKPLYCSLSLLLFLLPHYFVGPLNCSSYHAYSDQSFVFASHYSDSHGHAASDFFCCLLGLAEYAACSRMSVKTFLIFTPKDRLSSSSQPTSYSVTILEGVTERVLLLSKCWDAPCFTLACNNALQPREIQVWLYLYCNSIVFNEWISLWNIQIAAAT